MSLFSSKSKSSTTTDASAKTATGGGSVLTAGANSKIGTSDVTVGKGGTLNVSSTDLGAVAQGFGFAGSALDLTGTVIERALSAVDNANARTSALASPRDTQAQVLAAVDPLAKSSQPATMTGVLGKWGGWLALALALIAAAYFWSKRK